MENHIGELVSIDFLTVPTLSFRVLFVFVVLAHERRRVVHFNVGSKKPWLADRESSSRINLSNSRLFTSLISSPKRQNCGALTFRNTTAFLESPTGVTQGQSVLS